MGILNVDVLATKLELVTPQRIAQVFIDLTQILWTTETRRRICGVVWPVAREGNGIAADRSGGAGKYEEAWSNRLGAIRLTAIQSIEGNFTFRNQTR